MRCIGSEAVSVLFDGTFLFLLLVQEGLNRRFRTMIPQSLSLTFFVTVAISIGFLKQWVCRNRIIILKGFTRICLLRFLPLFH